MRALRRVLGWPHPQWRRWFSVRPDDFEKLLQADISEQAPLLESRLVAFAAGASSDFRPKVAAREAFQLVSQSLAREPNFCFFATSYEQSMALDVAEVLLSMLNIPHTEGYTEKCLVGCVVRNQRFAAESHLQLILGTVPDIALRVHTLDVLPSVEEITSAATPGAMALSFVDATLAIELEPQVVANVGTVAERLGNVPVVGCVLPPVVSRGGEQSAHADSLFFVQDKVYQGSAAVVVVQSALLKCESFSVVPTVHLGEVVAEGVSMCNGAWHVKKLSGQHAADSVASVYRVLEGTNKQSKVFLEIQDGESVVPLPFRVDAAEGVRLVMPAGLSLNDGQHLRFVCDDTEVDAEMTAAALHRTWGPLRSKTPVLRRRYTGPVAAACGLHFSPPTMNIPLRRFDSISLWEVSGHGKVAYTPPLMQRIAGTSLPNTGVFAPGQIVKVGSHTIIGGRSTSMAIVHGLK